MILLDTTVLVYAVGAQHPLQAPCRALIDAIGAGDLSATATPQTIQEFTHVRARRRGRGDAVHLAGAYMELLAPLTTVEPEDLRRGLDLFRATPTLGAFDAMLAAVVLGRSNITALVSADKAFAEVDGLNHLTPESAMTPHPEDA